MPFVTRVYPSSLDLRGSQRAMQESTRHPRVGAARNAGKHPSFPRRRESRTAARAWTPAFAGARDFASWLAPPPAFPTGSTPAASTRPPTPPQNLLPVPHRARIALLVPVEELVLAERADPLVRRVRQRRRHWRHARPLRLLPPPRPRAPYFIHKRQYPTSWRRTRSDQWPLPMPPARRRASSAPRI